MTRAGDTNLEGLERLRAVVQANPRSTAFVAFAHGLCDAGRAAEAEEICRQGLLQHPRLATGQVALGRALLERARLREAQEILIESVKANPEHGDGFRVLGEVVLKRGDLLRARAILEHAEELMPHDGRVAALLVQAGGTPVTRAPRPKTDFDHTRVANARALAAHMHEPAAEPIESTRPVEDAATGTGSDAAASSIKPLDDPTSINLTPAPAAWFSSPADAATPGPTPLAGDKPAARATTPSGQFPAAATRPATPSGSVPIVPATGPAPAPPAALGSAGSIVSHSAQAHPVLSARRGPEAPATRLVPVGVAAVVVLLLGAYFLFRGGPAAPTAGDPRPLLRASLAKGSLADLQTVVQLGHALLSSTPSDVASAGTMAFAGALLATDYGLPTATGTERVLATADATGLPSGTDAATRAAAHALLSLSQGALPAARAHAARALAADADSVEALVVAARLKTLSGDLDGARRDLEKVIGRAPDYATAVLDWAQLWLDLGDSTTAAGSLRAMVAKNPDHLRAQLLLAEAHRDAGTAGARSFSGPCAKLPGIATTIRAACALSAAAEARLAGDRASALKAVKGSLAEAAADPRLLATAAQELALLGENDVAAVVADQARRLATPTFAALVWADVAVRLGRAQALPAGVILPRAVSPETRLLAARAAYVSGGAQALAATLRGFGPAVVAVDGDARDFAILAKDKPTAADKAALQVRALAGHPVAAYALGRIANAADNTSVSIPVLARSLGGHGDACTAAGQMQAIPSARSQSPVVHQALRALRARNTACSAVSTVR